MSILTMALDFIQRLIGWISTRWRGAPLNEWADGRLVETDWTVDTIVINLRFLACDVSSVSITIRDGYES